MPPSLDGAHVLLTGATGFVGQAVLEKLLSSYPHTHVSLLVRPQGTVEATTRIENLLHERAFNPWVERVGVRAAQAALTERVTVLDGGLEAVGDLPDDLDVVIHSASTVSFDVPIDAAFAPNVGGPRSLYQALLATGSSPHVVHVSTAYVAGLHRGLAEERRLQHQVDPELELHHALRARGDAERASRHPKVLRQLLDDAKAAHRRAGAAAVAQAAENARLEWVRAELVAAGRMRARTLGWPDVYTLTKALGERVAENLWAAAGHRLSVVRPTVIESALRHPYPGWIDGFKVADPIIAAYGRGMLPEFPALADTVVDIIPVDFVVNAILAAAATGQTEEPAYFHVGSGRTNPLPFGRLYRLVREYFSANPLVDGDGTHVQVPSWSFPHARAVERALNRRELAVRVADKAVGRLPANQRTRTWISSLYRARRDLGSLRKFTDLYQAYTQTEIIFDDSNTRALQDALPVEARVEHGFDVGQLDWKHYLQEVHVPQVPGLMRSAEGESAGTTPRKPLPQRRDVLAVFDLQRTVAAATLVEHYLWVELARSPVRWPHSVANLAAQLPRYIQAEQRDRSDFIRTFMRRYAGVPEDELRKIMINQVSRSLFRGLHYEAVERIEEHRAAGHRTLLLTGEIDVFVEPLAPLFDVFVAGQMEKDDQGRWTGHLATSPLIGEARAAWLCRYAEDEGMDLSASYAYGDSYSDRSWLDVVGHPNAVNPDADLYRYAKMHRWPVHTWKTTAENRFTPVLRSFKRQGKL